ncbi:MAG: tRNA lysidine(34) synthetase TilS, partial [Candidatus Omnitrophica bacterium]|nr:tRNA lysidine(34) synthetase TilS [Candidatus Omnitrophota bacterium]
MTSLSQFRYFNYMAEPIFEKVFHFLRENNLLVGRHRILVAVSGGPDSCFLLHFFLWLRKQENIRLRVAYIHHHLRPEADRELTFVRKMAEKAGVPFSFRHIYLKRGNSLENQARLARYHALADIARRTKCQTIATGHTLDDQAETVLMKILRGCGLAGLRGIHPYAPGLPDCPISVIRPLLTLTKEEILKYLEQNSLPFL